MNILEIIAKKRDKQKLSKEEIEYFVQNYTNGNIPDYQASALTMAIYLKWNGRRGNNKLNLSNGTFWRYSRFIRIGNSS